MRHTIHEKRGRIEVKREKRYPSSSGMIPKEQQHISQGSQKVTVQQSDRDIQHHMWERIP